MSTFERVISVIFSVIVLILSTILMLTLGGVLSPDFGSNAMTSIVEGNIFSKILFVLAIIFFVLSLREIVFGQKGEPTKGKEGIILENESGKLIISKESLENLVAGVGKELTGAESITSRTYIDSEKNVTVDVNIVVSKDIAVKEISNELQKKVKSALKQTVDLDVKYVNIIIKNISNKKIKKQNTEDTNNKTTEL